MSVGPGAALGGVWPDLPTFRELAQDRRVIPVVRRLLADGETPVALYRKLAADAPGTFLLESAEHGGVWSRYSIVGAASRATLTERDGHAVWLGEPPVGVPTEGPVLDALTGTLHALATPRLPDLPPLTGGMVGVVGYDAVRHWERIEHAEHAPADELQVPDVVMSLATDLAVLDHADATVLLIANAVNYDATDERVDEAWADAVTRLDRMTADLAAPAPSTVAVFDTAARAEPRPRTCREDYLDAVRAGQQAIRDGEVFQVVLSQRFDVDCPADALDVYRCLRASNPSPYMYLLRCPTADGQTFDVVGSSPEALVKLSGGRVLAHPIAGTRPRGEKPEDDARLADDLLADAKERAEHLMLVDLARNDLSHIGEPGSVEVVDFMSVERYSHVMHLVSTVTAEQSPDADAVDVLKAAFPAGTLSGAPKPRAMQLIEELEPARRGVYGGVVGYLDFAGDMDLAIAIRTAVLRDGVAHVQAGAGIVADSVPESEHAECQHKAAAVLTAVARACTVSAATAVLLAATRPWVRVDLTRVLTGAPEAAVPGSDVAPLVPAVALVGLAAAAAAAIGGRRGARLAGAAVLLAGACAVLASLAALRDPSSAAAAALAGTTGGVGVPPGAVTATAWPVLAASAGLVLAFAGAAAVLLAGRWATASRFDPARRRPDDDRPGAPSGSDWDALTHGIDPTAAPRAENGRD